MHLGREDRCHRRRLHDAGHGRDHVPAPGPRAPQPLATRILLTGYADKQNAIRAINEAGLYYYLEKPWDNDHLKMVIRNGIERSALFTELDARCRALEARTSSCTASGADSSRRSCEHGPRAGAPNTRSRATATARARGAARPLRSWSARRGWRRWGMLVAGLAHEINTPLGALNSNHDVLKRALNKLQDILADDVVEPHELDEVRASSAPWTASCR
jgi:CheY-like chemotaxis protein